MNNKKYRKMFTFLKNKKIVYFDNSAATLRPKTVNDAVYNYDEHLAANAFRGVYDLGHKVTTMVEETRKNIAALINANSDEIVFTKNSTEALNIIAQNLALTLNEGDEIVLSELEHHSNLIPWLEAAKQKGAVVKTVPLDKHNKITVSNFKSVFTEKTKIVALTMLSNSLGYKTPIKEIGRIVKKTNAIFVCDAAQAVGHFEIDVKKLNIDFLAFSGYKMYGPMGVGVLFGKNNLLNTFAKYNHGGGTVLDIVCDSNKEMVSSLPESSTKFKINDEEFSVAYKPIPERLEGGTLPISSIIGLNQAVSFINQITYTEIQKYDLYLRNYLIDELSKIKEVEIYSKNPDVAIINFNIKNVHPHDAATIYNDQNICLRAGFHCAKLVQNKLQLNSSLRVSLSFYNTCSEIDRFIKATKHVINFFNSF